MKLSVLLKGDICVKHQRTRLDQCMGITSDVSEVEKIKLVEFKKEQ